MCCAASIDHSCKLNVCKTDTIESVSSLECSQDRYPRFFWSFLSFNINVFLKSMSNSILYLESNAFHVCRMKLSMYASVTNVIPKLDEQQSAISGRILDLTFRVYLSFHLVWWYLVSDEICIVLLNPFNYRYCRKRKESSSELWNWSPEDVTIWYM